MIEAIIIGKIVDLSKDLALAEAEVTKLKIELSETKINLVRASNNAERYEKLYVVEKVEHANANKAVAEVCDALRQVRGVKNISAAELKMAERIGRAAMHHDNIPF